MPVQELKAAKELADKRAKGLEFELVEKERVRVPPTHTHLAWRACVCHLPPTCLFETLPFRLVHHHLIDLRTGPSL